MAIQEGRECNTQVLPLWKKELNGQQARSNFPSHPEYFLPSLHDLSTRFPLPLGASFAVIRHHSQGNLQKKEVLKGLQFQEVS